MLQGSIDPVWCDQLSLIVLDCAGTGDGAQDRLLRKLAYCLLTAPLGLREYVAPSVSETELDALLDLEAFESAIFGLLGGNFSVLVSKHGSGDALATLGLPGFVDEVTICSNTITTALVGACAASLIKLVLVLEEKRQSPSLN